MKLKLGLLTFTLAACASQHPPVRCPVCPQVCPHPQPHTVITPNPNVPKNVQRLFEPMKIKKKDNATSSDPS